MNFAKVLLKFLLKNHETLLMFSWKRVAGAYTVSFNVCPNQTFSQVEKIWNQVAVCGVLD